MAFRTITETYGEKFNSDISREFLTQYEDYIDAEMQLEQEHTKSRAFAPSSSECMRLQWFRLRGTLPDKLDKPDKTTNFMARLGTACHSMVQKDLMQMFKKKNSLNGRWVEVKEYLQKYEPLKGYEYNLIQSGYETRINIKYPPIHFACDGIIEFNEIPYLLEIKTSESKSFRTLAQVKDEHRTQISWYMTLLNLRNAVVLYLDRTFGKMKCYEISITDKQMEKVKSTIEIVIDYVNKNIAPPKVQPGSPICGYCIYKNSCRQWG